VKGLPPQPVAAAAALERCAALPKLSDFSQLAVSSGTETPQQKLSGFLQGA
jgi:hypothetical protein